VLPPGELNGTISEQLSICSESLMTTAVSVLRQSWLVSKLHTRATKNNFVGCRRGVDAKKLIASKKNVTRRGHVLFVSASRSAITVAC